MSGVAGDVLLANLVSGPIDPVFGVTAMVSEDIWIYFLGGGQSGSLLPVAFELHAINLLPAATSNADFTVDAARSLTKEIVLGGNVTGVARQILASPAS